LTTVLSVAVVVVGVLRTVRPRRAGTLAGVAAALIVVDLALTGATLNPTVPPEFYRLRPPILEALRQDDLSRLFVYRYPFFAASPEPGSADDPHRIARYPPGFSMSAGPRFSGTARVVQWRADRVRMEVETSGPGVVVLVDGYDPGWRVSVDGRPAPLLRANVAFRGVAVPAGRHVVEQVYRPW